MGAFDPAMIERQAIEFWQNYRLLIAQGVWLGIVSAWLTIKAVEWIFGVFKPHK